MKLMLTQHSMFKTPEGQARCLAAYDATLALWPVPVESVDVPTRFGNTHVNACGPEGAPPLLLLHAFAISSTMWYPNVAELSRSYRIYALDTIGDKGKSVSTRPILPPLDFVTWLSDVFDALRLEQAHVAGLSFGGFLALNLALSVIPAALEGLKPESHSECVKFSGGQRRVSDPLVDSRFQLVKTLPERRVVRHQVWLDV